MSDLPLVTLITPSYNQAEFLEATMRSVLAQDYPRLEYLVVDGGSSDGSLDIVRRYADRLAYWESTPDRGQAHAINKGLQRAQGELLGWLNSDDVLLPGVVTHMVQTFAQHPQVDVIYGRLERINAAGAPIPTPLLPKDQLTYGRAHLIGECIVNQPGSFWRRSIMQRVGMLDETLRYNLDYEYWQRIALAGGVFMRLEQPVAHFRLSSGSKTVGQTADMALEQMQVLERLLARPDLPAQTGLSAAQVQRQARRARAVIGLHAAYGLVRRRRWQPAVIWLLRSVWQDPLVLLERRWRDLLAAGIRRRRG